MLKKRPDLPTPDMEPCVEFFAMLTGNPSLAWAFFHTLAAGQQA
jgi:hypothetical protein